MEFHTDIQMTPFRFERVRYNSKTKTFFNKSKYTLNKSTLAWLVKKEWKNFPSTDLLCLGCIFNVKKAKSSKLKVPHMDVDNMLKAVLDALNGVCYVDDKQVAAVWAEKRFSENPSIEITIASYSSG